MTGAVLVFHLGDAGGPGHSLLPAMTALARAGGIETIVPEQGPVVDMYAALGPVSVARYGALTYVRNPREAVRLAQRLVRETRAFRRALRQREPDLVVVVTTTLPSALLAARLERIPALVYAAEIYDQGWKGSPLLGLSGSVLAALTVRLASGVVCCSELVARQFRRRPGTPVVVAYPPIGKEYAQGDRARGRACFGLEAADPGLAVVGALSRGRGQDVAVRALALIRRRLPGARLVIVGAPHPRAADLEFADELRALTRDLGIEESVVFAGATCSTADVYAAADVVLNPARFAEPFGRVVPEALLAGTPVVASRVGALEEVIRAEVDGLLVAPDDPEALAGAVYRLWEEPSLRERLVEAGIKRVRDRFTERKNLAVWKAALRELPSPRGA
jgi:glycosyltransferase involved in cell wall biosynthesis